MGIQNTKTQKKPKPPPTTEERDKKRGPNTGAGQSLDQKGGAHKETRRRFQGSFVRILGLSGAPPTVTTMGSGERVTEGSKGKDHLTPLDASSNPSVHARGKRKEKKRKDQEQVGQGTNKLEVSQS